MVRPFARVSVRLSECLAAVVLLFAMTFHSAAVVRPVVAASLVLVITISK